MSLTTELLVLTFAIYVALGLAWTVWDHVSFKRRLRATTEGEKAVEAALNQGETSMSQIETKTQLNEGTPTSFEEDARRAEARRILGLSHQDLEDISSLKRYGVRACIEKIQPQNAGRYLATSPPKSNRSISAIAMPIYRRDISSGAWMLNGETIIFDKEERLMNGHNRLTACYKGNNWFLTLVVRGIDRATMPTLDTGKVRTLQDSAKIAGVQNHITVCSIVRYLNIIDRVAQGMSHVHTKITPMDLIAEISYRGDALQKAASMAQSVAKLAPVGVSGAMYYEFSAIDKAAADKFFYDFRLGANLDVADPVFHLRDRLSREVRNKFEAKKSIVKQEEIATFFIRAWNARRKGQNISYLRGVLFDKDGRTMYPKIDGKIYDEPEDLAGEFRS